MIGLGSPGKAMSASPAKVSLLSLPLMRLADWLHPFPMIFLLGRINAFLGSGIHLDWAQLSSSIGVKKCYGLSHLGCSVGHVGIHLMYVVYPIGGQF